MSWIFFCFSWHAGVISRNDSVRGRWHEVHFEKICFLQSKDLTDCWMAHAFKVKNDWLMDRLCFQISSLQCVLSMGGRWMTSQKHWLAGVWSVGMFWHIVFVKEARTKSVNVPVFYCSDTIITPDCERDPITCPVNILHRRILAHLQTDFHSFAFTKEPYAWFATSSPAADCVMLTEATNSSFTLLWGWRLRPYSFMSVCLCANCVFIAFIYPAAFPPPSPLLPYTIKNGWELYLVRGISLCQPTVVVFKWMRCVCVRVWVTLCGFLLSRWGWWDKWMRGYRWVKPVYCQVTQSSAAQRLESMQTEAQVDGTILVVRQTTPQRWNSPTEN